tara:strand:- start:682 stop:1083 length:402 start_codon:yes stop_codon:yes gene_type:complete
MLGYFKSIQKFVENLSLVERFLFILVCVLVFYLLYRFLMSQKHENFSNPKTCTYYYMDNCGYCEKFTPEWDKFVSEYSGSVVLQKKERNEAGSELDKYNIEGFPTVILCDDNGDYKEFTGERTSSGLASFVGN